jgi:hypothetical protein
MKLAIFTIAYRYLKKNFSKIVIWQMKLLSKNISNPLLLFLLWQDQEKLVDIAKMPHDTQIALGDHDLENLLNEVGTQKTMDEFTDQALY